MKEYEIVAKFCNACAGNSRPQTFFEEAEVESTDDFVRMKHSKDFDKFSKEVLPTGQLSINMIMAVLCILMNLLNFNWGK